MLQLAGCVIRDESGRVLLIHRNTAAYMHWEVPGGKVDAGEEARDAAVRELREELGIDVAVSEYIGALAFVDRGKPMRYSYFAARIVGGEPAIQEQHLHDSFDYHDIAASDQSTVFSLAAKRLIEELAAGRIELPTLTCE